MSYYLAIDFGTTLTQAAIYEPNVEAERPIELYEGVGTNGNYGLPSLYFYSKENGVMIGEEALEFAGGKYKNNLIRDVKMDGFQIKRGERLQVNQVEIKRYPLDDRFISAKEIIKIIYKEVLNESLKEAKRIKFGLDPEGIVLTVPAGFGYLERKTIRESAEEALEELNKNIPITDMIKEPVAAAINSFREYRGKEEVVALVYDLGGGTCDMALVRMNPQDTYKFQVIDQKMDRIGGRDFDKRLVEYIESKLREAGCSKMDSFLQRDIREKAVELKERLSRREKVNVDFCFYIDNQPKYVSITITRDDFENITKDLLNRTIITLKELYNAYRTKYKISQVVCVGGGSQMPMVEKAIADALHISIRRDQPRTAVVFGAAYYGNMHTKVRIRDIANYSYGVACWDEPNDEKRRAKIVNIIKKGTPFIGNVISNEHSFGLYEGGITNVVLNVYETDNDDQSFYIDEAQSELQYRCIETLELKGVPLSADNSYKIICRMELDHDNILSIEINGENGERVKGILTYANL